MTRIVHELAARGHELHVVTALPWYRDHAVEPDWRGRLVRTETTSWGSIRRVHPFPTNKRSVPRRAIAFGAFSALAGLGGIAGRGVDGVLAMSPPLTLGLTAWGVSLLRGGPLVFNVQDIFPDVALEVGALTNHRVVAVARWLERVTYGRADAVTVLSTDLQENVRAKVAEGQRAKVRVIPNFVDTSAVRPGDRMTAYRRELGIGNETVVLYAGNIGFSQSLDMVADAARALVHRDGTVFVFNGAGSGLEALRRQTRGLPNVRFAPYQPRERLGEVLASGDIHLVPLRKGLAAASVPSKTYSILAAGRPVLASVDAGTEVARVVQEARCGVAVAPDDPGAFGSALERLLDDEDERQAMGRRGRQWVERWASPAAVAAAYEVLFQELRADQGFPDPTR